MREASRQRLLSRRRPGLPELAQRREFARRLCDGVAINAAKASRRGTLAALSRERLLAGLRDFVRKLTNCRDEGAGEEAEEGRLRQRNERLRDD